MKRFLQETWELFYWSLCCPSRLQERMNDWSPAEIKDGQKLNTFAWDILLFRPNSRFIIQYLSPAEIKDGQKLNTFAWDILLFRPNSRFIIQYFLISAVLSLPLAGLISFSDRGSDWLLGLAALLISYGLGRLFLPAGIGFCSPLLLALTYWYHPQLFTESLQTVLEFLPPLSQLAIGVATGATALIITFWIRLELLRRDSLSLAWNSPWLGRGLSILAGSWLDVTYGVTVIASGVIAGIATVIFVHGVAHGLVYGIVAGTIIGITIVIVCEFVEFFINFLTVAEMGVARNNLISSILGGIIYGLACVIAVGLSIAVASVVAVVVVVVAAIVFALPLPWFLAGCILIATSTAPLKHQWLGVIIAIILAAMRQEWLNFCALWVVPVTLVSYYRILPDYVFYVGSLISTSRILKRSALNSAQRLTQLPPYTTELLWLPLPNHANILASAFHQDPNVGLAAFQKMQTIALPGLQHTIQQALPLIVAAQLASNSTTSALINSINPDHPVLSLLIPAYYQGISGETVEITADSGNSDIAILFPRFQQVASDTEAALQAGSVALRERGLERLVDQLKLLAAQLPGLGIKPRTLQNWKLAIERWQHILELEIAEQQKLSQGELLNPFQFGNPLRPDRSTIFKGRQAFADQIVRLILDRNRPTLVLHGPRRAGKTSFLLNLPRLLPSDLIPIYLDMQQASMTDSEGDFCYGLVRAIQRDTRSQGLTLPPLPKRPDFYAKPYPVLEDWLDAVLPQLGERRLLLNLDEFEKIGNAIQERRISSRLFDQLRSLIQHYDQLGFLFSGVQTLDELGPRWSNYFISVVPMEMHYLEPHEAEDLLRNPDPEFALQYDTGVVEEILHLTHCQPYLLQLIGFALVTQANLQHTQLATQALLKDAIQAAFTNGEPYFTNIWTEFTGTTPEEVAAGQTLLLALAHRNDNQISSDQVTQAARSRLLRYHVIESIEDDRLPGHRSDRIEIPLFEQWVRERAIKA